MSRVIADQVCLCVCLCVVRALNRNIFELSTPQSVEILSMASHRHALTPRSKDYRVIMFKLCV